jgi:hypothetical protein
MGKAAKRGKTGTERKIWQRLGSNGVTCGFIMFLIGIQREGKNGLVLK